jgi:hypothetical protein
VLILNIHVKEIRFKLRSVCQFLPAASLCEAAAAAAAATNILLQLLLLRSAK